MLSVLMTCMVSGIPCRATDIPVDTALCLQEISVTAIKQSSDIGVQPVAATVIDRGNVERLNVVTMKDVSEVAPNFYIPDYGSRMTSSIYVRGIGARIDQPVIGMNVDNVPLMNKNNYDFDIVDIEKIEVLRGAQSTLYGRNTMGGMVNIYTLSPMKYQGMRFMGEYGSGNSIKASLSYYARLLPELGMSWSGYFSMSDGFFTNRDNGKKCDEEKQGNLRWKTVWRITENVMLENVAGMQVTRQGGYPYASIVTDEINYNDTCFYRRTGITDGLTVKWTPSNTFSLSSITSFQYIDDNMTLDQDFLPLEYFTLTQKCDEWAMTQDFVVSGSAGAYRWLGGVFGFYKSMEMDAPVTFKDYGIDKLIEKHRNDANPYYPIGWNDDAFVLGSNFRNPVHGVAAYHQSSYSSGRWNFTAGVRFDYEYTELEYNSFCNTSYTIYDHYTAGAKDDKVFRIDGVNIDDYGRLGKSFMELLPKFAVTYSLPTGMPSTVYASVSKGYKSGGYNTQMFSDVLQQRIMGLMGLGMKYDVDDVVGYKPEKSWNYEVGSHLSLFDGRMDIDAAAFYIDCRDQQLTMFPDGTTTGRIMTNAGKTRSAGVELTIGYRPDDRWAFNASYGYTDARFVEFDNGKGDFADNRIPYSPSNTLFAGVTYSLPVRSPWLDRVRLNVNVRSVGDIYWDEANSVKQPFYSMLGVSMRLEHDKYSLDLWGENLTDTDYKTFYFVSIGNGFYQSGKPCRVGVTLRMNFKTK
ncbi:MAG: TonB-dependent receptor [Muribaculaceae bacterium]|nr:TonB-dependent receptor [Muribaculaceae bacterium]